MDFMVDGTWIFLVFHFLVTDPMSDITDDNE